MRRPRKDLARCLERCFAGTKVLGKICVSLSLKETICLGYLVPVKLHRLHNLYQFLKVESKFFVGK